MAEPPVMDPPSGGQGQFANEEPLKALLDEAIKVVEDEGEEGADARLGAIQYVLDSGSFGHPSLYQLMPVDWIRIAFPGLPPFPDLVGMGRRLRRKILEILREILCSKGVVWRAARLAIEVVTEASVPGAIEAIATVLVSIGIAPAIAVLVAAWIGRMLLEEAFELSCEALGRYLARLYTA